MSADRRRQAILDAALPLFAAHGVRGVTTRQIAEASGVSEALLYKHFKSKEALYGALQVHCVGAARRAVVDEGELSTEALVAGLYWLFRWMILGGDKGQEHNRNIRRLMVTSVSEDGAFARGFFTQNTLPLLERMSAAFSAAANAGDLVDGVDPQLDTLWLAHACAAGVAMFANADEPIVDYGRTGDDLLDASLRFALRGIGLRSEAIDRCLAKAPFTLLNAE